MSNNIIKNYTKYTPKKTSPLKYTPKSNSLKNTRKITTYLKNTPKNTNPSKNKTRTTRSILKNNLNNYLNHINKIKLISYNLNLHNLINNEQLFNLYNQQINRRIKTNINNDKKISIIKDYNFLNNLKLLILYYNTYDKEYFNQEKNIINELDNENLTNPELLLRYINNDNYLELIIYQMKVVEPNNNILIKTMKENIYFKTTNYLFKNYGEQIFKKVNEMLEQTRHDNELSDINIQDKLLLEFIDYISFGDDINTNICNLISHVLHFGIILDYNLMKSKYSINFFDSCSLLFNTKLYKDLVQCLNNYYILFNHMLNHKFKKKFNPSINNYVLKINNSKKDLIKRQIELYSNENFYHGNILKGLILPSSSILNIDNLLKTFCVPIFQILTTTRKVHDTIFLPTQNLSHDYYSHNIVAINFINFKYNIMKKYYKLCKKLIDEILKINDNEFKYIFYNIIHELELFLPIKNLKIYNNNFIENNNKYYFDWLYRVLGHSVFFKDNISNIPHMTIYKIYNDKFDKKYTIIEIITFIEFIKKFINNNKNEIIELYNENNFNFTKKWPESKIDYIKNKYEEFINFVKEN